MTVSISWARFCLFKQEQIRVRRQGHGGFNLLGEILFVQARATTPPKRSLMAFQSLGRDSVCSSCVSSNDFGSGIFVSISWARFCLFKHPDKNTLQQSMQGFNLLGEILFVQAFVSVPIDFLYCMFQSLGRDSVCSSEESPVCPLRGRQFQSLGRDSVCSSLETGQLPGTRMQVSISWARFCLFKHGCHLALVLLGGKFQSLGRDSVCSSWATARLSPLRLSVSISWARFCLFKLLS